MFRDAGSSKFWSERGCGLSRLRYARDTMHVDLADAARCLEELVRAAQRGEPVTITTPGGLVRLEPVAGTVDARRTPVFGALRGTARMTDDFDASLDDFVEYER